MKIAIYTVILNNYDTPQDVSMFKHPDVDFVFVHDIVTKVPDKLGWKSVIFESEERLSYRELIKLTRFYKLNPYRIQYVQDSDINVYIDGSRIIKYFNKILLFCEKLNNSLNYDAYFLRHTHRSTLLAEVEEVLRLHLDDSTIIKNQYKQYLLEGFTDTIPLIAGSSQFRKTKSISLHNFLSLWYGEVNKFSFRDQLSFSYSVWKSGFNRYKLLDGKDPSYPIRYIGHIKTYTEFT